MTTIAQAEKVSAARWGVTKKGIPIFELQIKWEGKSKKSWEPFQIFYADAAELVHAYLDDEEYDDPEALKDEIRAQIRIFEQEVGVVVVAQDEDEEGEWNGEDDQEEEAENQEVEEPPVFKRFRIHNVDDKDDETKARLVKYQAMQRLRSINANNDNLTPRLMLELLPYCKGMININVSSNPLGWEGLIDLAQALEHCPELKTLYVQNIDIQSIRVVILMNAISRHCPNLTILDLSENHLKNSGAELVSNGILYHQSLKILKLNQCNIADQGTQHLAVAIQTCPQLQQLHMENNDGFTDKSINILALAICHCPQFEFLDIMGNDTTYVTGFQYLKAIIPLCPNFYKLMMTLRGTENMVPKLHELESLFTRRIFMTFFAGIPHANASLKLLYYKDGDGAIRSRVLKWLL